MIDQMLEKISEGLPIDVFSAVKSLRTRRQEMVQGNVRHPMFFVAISISQGRFRLQAQYSFIYVALLEAVLCGNTQIPVQNLRSAFSKLSEKDSKGRCGFELQYRVRISPLLCYAYVLVIQVLETASAHVSKALRMTGRDPRVQKKNRYLDIVPRNFHINIPRIFDVYSLVDSERVVLRLEEAVSGDSNAAYANAAAGSNYINASYVNVSKGLFLV